MEQNPTHVSTDESLKDDTDDDSTSSRRRSSSSKIAAPLFSRERPTAAEEPVREVEKTRRLQDILLEKKAEIPVEAEAETETSNAESVETLSQLDSEESQHIVSEFAQAELDARQGLDAETTVALEDGTRFLEQVSAGADPEVAFSEIATELGMSEDEIAIALSEVTPEDELDEEPEESEVEAGELPEAPVEVDDDEGEIDLSSAAATSSTTAASGSSSGGGSGLGGGTPPPVTPPASPAPGSTPSARRAPAPASAAPASGSTLAPVIANANHLPTPARNYYERRRQAGQLLLVGVLAYLYGRRKGRLRTEKRFKPVQAKLEKQVTSLQQDVSRKEQQLVALKAEQRPAAKTARPETLTRSEAVKPAEVRRQPGRQETRLGLEKPVRIERLGQVVVAAEAPKVIKIAERSRAEQPLGSLKNIRPEAVKVMSRAELLELSEKIVVEGASLRRIYESHLIGEKQLRHLVGEYLQGKDIRKDLRREMVEREIDFERDPMMRDRVRTAGSSQANDSSALGAMLASAGIVDDAPNPELERRRQRAAQQQASRQRHQKQQRMVTDVALTTAIVVLAVAVIILLLRG